MQVEDYSLFISFSVDIIDGQERLFCGPKNVKDGLKMRQRCTMYAKK